MKIRQPDSGVYANEEWSADRIKDLTMSKIHSASAFADDYTPRHFAKRFAIAAVAVVLLFALATTALAVSGIIDFGTVFDSIFRNKEAAPYIQTGDDITMQPHEVLSEDEVTVEPIAAFFESALSGLYLELRITDPIGGRLSDSLLFLTLSGLMEHPLSTGDVSVELIDANTAVANLFISPVNPGDATIQIVKIASGINYYYEAQPTQFNIGEHLSIDAPVIVPGAEFIEVTGITQSGGMITIAFRDSDSSMYGWGSAFLGVKKPDGGIIWGNGVSASAATEMRFSYIDIGDLDPNDLTLVWNGSRADYVITGNWEFTVSGDNVLQPRLIDGEFEGNSVRVKLGATSIEFLMEADYYYNAFPYDILETDAVTILLEDGTIIHPRFDSSMFDSVMTASFAYTMNFTNPDSVVSVTFYGTTITE